MLKKNFNIDAWFALKPFHSKMEQLLWEIYCIPNVYTEIQDGWGFAEIMLDGWKKGLIA